MVLITSVHRTTLNRLINYSASSHTASSALERTALLQHFHVNVKLLSGAALALNLRCLSHSCYLL